MALPVQTMKFRIAADHDPLVCSRILGLFAQRNLIPGRFSAWKENDEVMRIVMLVSSPADLDWRLLWHRIEAIPSAISVDVEPLACSWR